MENLLETLTTMETIAKLRSDLNKKIDAYIQEHKLFGDYKIKSPFYMGDEMIAVAFEVEWVDWQDHSEGKTIYFYKHYDGGDQADGEYIYEISLLSLDHFYNNVLLANAYEPWS